jgi:hypothetical protein
VPWVKAFAAMTDDDRSMDLDLWNDDDLAKVDFSQKDSGFGFDFGPHGLPKLHQDVEEAADSGSMRSSFGNHTTVRTGIRCWTWLC